MLFFTPHLLNGFKEASPSHYPGLDTFYLIIEIKQLAVCPTIDGLKYELLNPNHQVNPAKIQHINKVKPPAR